MIIEILGPNGSDRANALAEKLRNVLQDQAKVARPIVKGEIRLVGLDDSISENEVACVVTQYGGCKEEEIKVGTIRPMNNGLFTVWAQCPLSAAIKTANSKKVRIGWTIARVDLLDARPVQCFKCWRFGHVRLTCTAEEDYSRLCFKCGGPGHAARDCNLPSSCKICLSEGKNPNHRIGSNLCTAEHRTVKSRASFRTAGLNRFGRTGEAPNPSQGATQMDVDAH
ncbi:uncharacterized protein LOC115240097 [Formica exsecta]|uniref:uncharacterized protein LOC115240097 n=1 Tax=Formica exsecta TaxID=72781 RepID=UPI0011443DF9|nr:uncharacterized protein LOC115240097 [Formica exsecta]